MLNRTWQSASVEGGNLASMSSDYCVYPPEIAADVEAIEQRDGDRTVFTVGSISRGRFILLRENEDKVRRLLDGSLTPAMVCDEFQKRHGGKLSQATLIRFLTRLDELGIVAGGRANRSLPPEAQPSTQFYLRFKLFDPDSLFTWMVRYLRWIWTPRFVVATAALMLTALFLALSNRSDVSSYGLYIVREHYLAVLLAGEFIALSHEFAHGLTCKAFGGRVPEIGMLQIYYVIPALYCNVSGIHLIPQRSRRLWVILAGIYWQLLAGAVALLAWFFIVPYTLMSDIAFSFFVAAVVDVILNANPLIKLDGYYFLSQWLRLPNLMERSRACWREFLRRIFCGVKGRTHCSRRERAIYFSFGFISFLYSAGLRVFIVCVVGDCLMDRFQLTGLVITVCLALFYIRQTLKHSIVAVNFIRRRISAALSKKEMGHIMATDKTMAERIPRQISRRLFVPLSAAALIGVLLLIPWNASIGNYGTLMRLAGKETIIRAPEDGTLVRLNVKPGDVVTGGTVLGRINNAEFADKLANLRAELSRAHTDYSRLVGELRASNESVIRADVLLRQRQLDLDEIHTEQRQINRYAQNDTTASTLQVASTQDLTGITIPSKTTAQTLPAALAVLRTEIDSRNAQLQEAALQSDRAKALFAEGLVARREVDSAEARAVALSMEWIASREKLEAALVEHQRKHARSATDLDLSRSDLQAGRWQVERLETEIQTVQTLIQALEQRRDSLQQRIAEFEFTTPRAGTIFGDDLPRLIGQDFRKGAEVLRVADNSELLFRIQVNERQFDDVRVGSAVRLRTRSHPNRVFHGVVSNVGSQSEPDDNGQATYRVELVIDNANGLLRPGMTAYARVYYDRQMLIRILMHKVRQALRPELWIL